MRSLAGMHRGVAMEKRVWTGAGDAGYSPPNEGDEPLLRHLLLAHKTRSLALPESTAFEPLRPVATNVPLGDDSYFATHTTYQVPVDGLHVRPGQTLEPGQTDLVDLVHRFAVKRSIAAPLSDRLTSWAMHKERLGKDAEGRLGLVTAGKGSDAGVQKTNVGGFQSFHDLFDEPADDEGGDDGDSGDDGPEWLVRAKTDCLLVRAIASAAIDEVDADHYPGGEAAAHKPAAGRPHPGYAWLNVNRSADSNFMHTHQVDLWSAVYYVSEGEPNAPGFPEPCGGHMIFRCGPRPQGEGGPRRTAEGTPWRSYLAVPPQPGTLWLFPGSMPHLVMQRAAPHVPRVRRVLRAWPASVVGSWRPGVQAPSRSARCFLIPQVLPPGVAEPEVPRVSVGVNFDFATPPLPEPWRAPRRASEAAEAAAAAVASPLVAAVGEEKPVVAARSMPEVAAAEPAVASEAGDATGRAEREGERWPTSQTQLLMGAEEAAARGFGADEEVVMPLPVWSDSDEEGG